MYSIICHHTTFFVLINNNPAATIINQRDKYIMGFSVEMLARSRVTYRKVVMSLRYLGVAYKET
jgi:hypothetical protein